jgi:hypothetical protein
MGSSETTAGAVFSQPMCDEGSTGPRLISLATRRTLLYYKPASIEDIPPVTLDYEEEELLIAPA